MRSYRRESYVAVLLIVLFLSACAIKYNKAVETAEAVKDAYPLVQKSFAQAYNDKKINDEQWADYVALDKQILQKQNALVDALKLYNAAKRTGVDPGNSLETIVKLRGELKLLYSRALKMAQEYGVKISAGGQR